MKNFKEIVSTLIKKVEENQKSTYPNCVIYTRVSSKKQETRFSLTTQLESCQSFCASRKLNVIKIFGGTYESAKNDDRKNYKMMLDFVKKPSNKVSFIIVSSIDRFSRSEGGDPQRYELKSKYNISVIAVNNPHDDGYHGDFIDTIMLATSKLENDLRREKAIIGMRKRLSLGLLIGRAPKGYSYITGKDGSRKLEIDKNGKLIQIAFELKANGVGNQEICFRLKQLGLIIKPNKLYRIFNNFFYVGYINHRLLEGEIKKGQHEALVSEDIFIKANGLINKRNPLESRSSLFFLNGFIHESSTGITLTGYNRQKKTLSGTKVYGYYKTNYGPPPFNIRREKLEDEFLNLLSKYKVEAEIKSVLKEQLIITFKKMNQIVITQTREAKENLKKIEFKIEKLLEERYIKDTIEEPHFSQLMKAYESEKTNCESIIYSYTNDLSNLEDYVDLGLKIAENLTELYKNGDNETKRDLQFLIFPEGVDYDIKKKEYRTRRINMFFELNSSASNNCDEKRKGITPFEIELSPSAVRTGLEPATSCVTGRHSNQLNYRTI